MPPELKIPEFSKSIFALYIAIFILGLTIKQSSGQVIAFLCMTAIAIHSLSYASSTGDLSQDYLFLPFVFCYLLYAADYLVISDTHELRFVGQKDSVADAPLLQRLRWAVKLFFAPRGVGWTHQVKSLSPVPKNTRIGFILAQLGLVALEFIVYDVVNLINQRNPAFQTGNASTIADASLIWRGIYILAMLIPSTLGADIAFRIITVASVATLTSRPEEWPPFFGSWRDAYTVRRLWSHTWHQLLRRIFTTHGKFFAQRVFRLERGTILSSLVQLFTAFILSGIIHQMADSVMLQKFPWKGGSFKFFFVQTLAIIFEDTVRYLGKKLGIQRVNKIFGYVWVLCWFSWCMPIMQDPILRAGILGVGVDTSLLSPFLEKRYLEI
ncbi:membrane bound O-acyl transferase family-domain-containing protein [Mycena floridula]|nr:membrane bound O-acyl transferase family-domain-containing protein [Mycena floridula]